MNVKHKVKYLKQKSENYKKNTLFNVFGDSDKYNYDVFNKQTNTHDRSQLWLHFENKTYYCYQFIIKNKRSFNRKKTNIEDENFTFRVDSIYQYFSQENFDESSQETEGKSDRLLEQTE